MVLLLPFGPVVLGCEEFLVSSLEQISWFCFRSHSVISQLDCFRVYDLPVVVKLEKVLMMRVHTYLSVFLSPFSLARPVFSFGSSED